MSTLLRGGRLARKTRTEVVDFISSFEADRKISRSIVLVNEAHVAALLKARLINKEEARKLTVELRKLENSFPRKAEGEDYHLYIEQQLTKRLGRLGEKLHTGKSRNDQVSTAIRMTLRRELLALSESLTGFVQELLRQADKHLNTFFVGYTHMQPAQPITFGHYLLSLTDALLRDNERILEAYHRVNLSPMGSG
ncbi:MAG TPA: lyase family protein, partial [Candidatus Bathyarchaeia archaeon]|nr:lyase family protein [Candidatus Bathyarchaeia archaeon]